MYFHLSIAALLSATTNAIIHGKDASIKDFPYYVTLDSDYDSERKYVCGGAIINENWVVTTALCTDYSLYEGLKIRAGTNVRDTGGSLHQVDLIVKHYNLHRHKGVFHNNIALIKVKQPFIFNETRQPIKLFDTGEKLVPGTMANVTGFGETECDIYSEFLQKIEVPVVNFSQCKQDLRNSYDEELADGQLCAAYEDDYGKNVRWNDEGGPLVVDGRLAGIASWLRHLTAAPDYPIVYTDIAYYRDWIDQSIQRYIF